MTQNSLDSGAVIATARKWIGTPYLHQAASRGIGCDCLGLVRGVWRELGGDEPQTPTDYSSTWNEIDHTEKLLTALREHLAEVSQSHTEEGQIVAFRLRRNAAAKHVAFLTGQGTFIHAYDGNHVVENALSPFWHRRIAGRFIFKNLRAN